MKAPVHRTTFGSGGSRLFSALVLLALVLLILPACEPAVIAPANTPTATPPTHLKVASTPGLSYAPLYIAQDEGYFAEQGLDIEFVQFTRGSDTTPVLASGELDVAPVPLDIGQFNAMARGARIRIVSDKGYFPPNPSCAYYALLARRSLLEEGKLSSPAQLRGLRVSVNPLNIRGYMLDKLLTSAGLTFNDIEVVKIDNPQETQALEDGSLDLAFMNEPNLTQALQGGKIAIWLPAEKIISDTQFSYVVYGARLLDQDPGAGQRFMVAYLKGVHQYNQGKTDRNVDILARNTKLDRDLVKQTCWLPMRDDGTIDVQSVVNFQNWAVQQKYLEKAATVEQFWDPRFIEYANNALKAKP